MLQKKGKKPVGFGSIVYTSSEFDTTRRDRNNNGKGSKLKYFGYHCIDDGYVVVGGFLNAKKEKYYKVVPIRKSNHYYINWSNIAIIHSKFILESERTLGTIFKEHTLKVVNDEAEKRFGKEFI